MTKSSEYVRYLIGLVIMLVYIVVGVIILSIGEPNPYLTIVRFGALYGYISMFFATILSNYIRDVRKIFNRPFLKIHHYFAAIGMVSITIHPVVFSIYAASLLVFVPDFSSWYAFWSLAGRPALYLAYTAVLVSLLRTKLPKYWRYFHGSMYVVLTFAFVHGFLIGANFTNPFIVVLFLIMLVLAYFTAISRFVRKRKGTN